MLINQKHGMRVMDTRLIGKIFYQVANLLEHMDRLMRRMKQLQLQIQLQIQFQKTLHLVLIYYIQRQPKDRRKKKQHGTHFIKKILICYLIRLKAE